MITALIAGATMITASAEGVSGSASLTVNATPPVAVASVSVSLSASSVVAGQSAQATATIKDASGNSLSGRVVTWESSNPGVATVSAAGTISTIAVGTTTITATSEGVAGSATLTVTAAPPAPVATVSVSLSASSLVAGQTGQATATLKDAGGNTLSGRVVTWQSSAPGVATISSSGGIAAIAAGTTTITATSEGKTGTATLTVTAAPPVAVASVTVSPTTASVQAGGTQQYTAVTRDASGNILTGRTITWGSNALGVATVSAGGLATAIATGSATITATSGTVSGTATINVTTSQLSTPVFSDDFESGNFSKWSEFNTTTQQIINNPASAHSGNNFLRLTYGINGEDAGWLNKYFTQGFTQLYVRYYVRFATNFVGGTKLIGFHGAPIGNPWAGVGRAGICPNGTDSFAALLVNDFGDTYPTKMYTYWQDMWADPDGRCWGKYGPTPNAYPYISPMPNLTKGVWHKIEYTIKMNSSATTADGSQKFWVDGVKYGEWTGIRWGDPQLINIGVFIISGSGNTTQIQTLDYDDLILTTDYPSQSQP
jgi:uncharacterized protein YjdB